MLRTFTQSSKNLKSKQKHILLESYRESLRINRRKLKVASGDQGLHHYSFMVCVSLSGLSCSLISGPLFSFIPTPVPFLLSCSLGSKVEVVVVRHAVYTEQTYPPSTRAGDLDSWRTGDDLCLG